MALVIAQQDLPFRQPGDKGTQEMTMIDFARNPVGRQAVRLSSTEVFTRKVCYFFARLASLPRFVLVLLKQKGNPALNA